ncbi:MAG: FtsX-like permease family protein [Myxococcales bacterium]|nr:FtsX-like permease family protein [Myxococcales bacterium]
METLGVALLRGRDVAWTDTDKSPHSVVVNEAFVQRFIPQGEPIGRRVKNLVGNSDWPWTIVGVVGDVRTAGLDRAPGPLIAVPLMQYPVQSLRLTARAASGDPFALLQPIHAEVAAIDKDVPVSAPRTLLQVVDDSLGAQRFQMTLLSLFAALALALSAVGIYGVMAYSVVQRSREIGIRMALGADASLVVRMVVGYGLRLAAAGVALGVAGAFAGTRLLASLVYQVSTTDPLTFAATAGVLVVAALLASWLPARRATRVDPAVSLRAE